jgi:hypothetical protein
MNSEDQLEQGHETVDRAEQIREMIEWYVSFFRRIICLNFGYSEDASIDFILNLEENMHRIETQITQEIESLLLETTDPKNALDIFDLWKERIKDEIRRLHTNVSKYQTKVINHRLQSEETARDFQMVLQTIAADISRITHETDAVPFKGVRFFEDRQRIISERSADVIKSRMYNFWLGLSSSCSSILPSALLDGDLKYRLHECYVNGIDEIKLHILERVYRK